MPEILPQPSTTLVVILGASCFPKSSSRLSDSPSFRRSAEGFRAYLLDKSGFGLPEENLLDLFDSPESIPVLDEKVGDFLKKRINKRGDYSSSIGDLVIYYVGHGGFSGGDKEYYLALRDTRIDNDLITSYSVRSLAKTLREYARNIRKYLIFDACFSAAAHKEFMSTGPLQVAVTKTLFELPEKGTALLSAAGAKCPALAPEDEDYTMFSGAMLHVLRESEWPSGNSLSFAELAEMTASWIREKYGSEGVRPEIHFPDQSDGIIGKLPFFHVKTNVSSLETKINDLAKSFEITKAESASIRNELPFLKESIETIKKNIDNIQQKTNQISIEKNEIDNDRLRRIGSHAISERDWAILPASVKGQLASTNRRYTNGLIWTLICLFIISIDWGGYYLPVNYRLGVFSTIMSIVFSMISINGIMKGYLSMYGETNESWEHFDAVIAWRNSQPVKVLPGFWMEKSTLGLLAFISTISSLGSILGYFPWFR